MFLSYVSKLTIAYFDLNESEKPLNYDDQTRFRLVNMEHGSV